MATHDKNHVSVWNWMGTLILYAIPGVNLLMLILTVIFAKAQPKRAFAIGALIIMAAGALLLAAAFLFLPDQMLQLAEWIRGTAA